LWLNPALGGPASLWLNPALGGPASSRGKLSIRSENDTLLLL